MTQTDGWTDRQTAIQFSKVDICQVIATYLITLLQVCTYISCHIMTLVYPSMCYLLEQKIDQAGRTETILKLGP